MFSHHLDENILDSGTFVFKDDPGNRSVFSFHLGWFILYCLVYKSISDKLCLTMCPDLIDIVTRSSKGVWCGLYSRHILIQKGIIHVLGRCFWINMTFMTNPLPIFECPLIRRVINLSSHIMDNLMILVLEVESQWMASK